MADPETGGSGLAGKAAKPGRLSRAAPVSFERRARDPAFLAALAALTFSIVALVTAAHGVLGGAGP